MKNNGAYAIVDMTPAYAENAKKAHNSPMLRGSVRLPYVVIIDLLAGALNPMILGAVSFGLFLFTV